MELINLLQKNGFWKCNGYVLKKTQGEKQDTQKLDRVKPGYFVLKHSTPTLLVVN